MAIFRGTSGRDIFNRGDFGRDTPSTSFDEFRLGAGNDEAFAGSHGSIMHGGQGKDILWGGGGTDWIFAGNFGEVVDASRKSAWGVDFVVGGGGEDHINWRNSKDNVTVYGDDPEVSASTGKAGRDFIDTGSGNDTIFGGGGKDIINSGDGNDKIFGGDAKDTIDGGWGRDQIHGDAGNDQISGGRDADDLWGGSGNDTFEYQRFTHDSDLSFDKADTIHDFKAHGENTFVGDKIDAGFNSTDAKNMGFHEINFDAKATDEQRFNTALEFAAVDNFLHFGSQKAVFVTDGRDGWLFMETNSNHFGLDTAIKMEGCTDFHPDNFIH